MFFLGGRGQRNKGHCIILFFFLSLAKARPPKILVARPPQKKGERSIFYIKGVKPVLEWP